MNGCDSIFHIYIRCNGGGTAPPSRTRSPPSPLSPPKNQETSTATAMATPAPLDIDGDDGAATDRAALSTLAGPGGGRDRISDLPDDLLVAILARLPDTAVAAQTSVLSHRWCGLWLRLSNLSLRHHPPNSRSVRAALAAHANRADAAILSLRVFAPDGADADAAASWLSFAAPRVSGEFRFHNRCSVPEEELLKEAMVDRGAFELPCFRRTSRIWLGLGFLGLSLPPSGVFTALIELCLDKAQFHDQCSTLELDDTMFPFLKYLRVQNARGLVNLAIRSKSLVMVVLRNFQGLQRLNVAAPGLKVLNVRFCLGVFYQVSYIDAQGLEELRWVDNYHPMWVRFSEMPYLQVVRPPPVSLSGLQNIEKFLKPISRIHRLEFWVAIQADLGNLQPLMDGITRLPEINILDLYFIAEGHTYGASVLHVLTMCTGIRELNLTLQASSEGQDSCSLNCICHQPPTWRAQNIQMVVLEKVEIRYFRGKEREVDFVKLLFRASPALRSMKITCHPSFAAWGELSEDLQSLVSQETSVEVTFASAAATTR